ncbi:hypothetical protein PAAG_05447 [Paracoccidioides lutzii Pb01]|uniref:Uncharacterized protein n=1 Tax=Paracoccidioides lutzii (strain ATCC MYA-826 / Pb01) TaxID=502779 RepID=C1H3V4_PARBA|nr:hypothetical protein PAAG_05447 [Paracoccidioides lutzii Pb01]EEH34398.2 hypothetical protein PAAG_05447 [Paracoccidioides lutzii Pb01]
MYFHTATQKFLILVPQENPAPKLPAADAAPLLISSPQSSPDDTESPASPLPQKTTRSPSTSSTSSTDSKSGFLRLGV